MITEKEKQAILNYPHVKWTGAGAWGETFDEDNDLIRK